MRRLHHNLIIHTNITNVGERKLLEEFIMHKEKCLIGSEFDQNVADGGVKCKLH